MNSQKKSLFFLKFSSTGKHILNIDFINIRIYVGLFVHTFFLKIIYKIKHMILIIPK